MHVIAHLFFLYCIYSGSADVPARKNLAMLFSVSPNDVPFVVQPLPTFFTTVTLVFSAGVASHVIPLVLASTVKSATTIASPSGLSNAVTGLNTSNVVLRIRTPAANTSISLIDATG